ncbi:hypothetical protein G9A89_000842 [Geosiphon pyriformis]|nr:hypothetical protein G9A89_000842 [Geosiphon pyriformis]
MTISWDHMTGSSSLGHHFITKRFDRKMDQEGKPLIESYETKWLPGEVGKKHLETTRARGLSDPGKERKVAFNTTGSSSSSKANKRFSSGSGFVEANENSGPSLPRARPISEGGKERIPIEQIRVGNSPRPLSRQSIANSTSGSQPATSSSSNPTGKKYMKDMTKSERRAFQDKQRAEKAALNPSILTKKPPTPTPDSLSPALPEKSLGTTIHTDTAGVKKTLGSLGGTPSTKQQQTKLSKDTSKEVALFSHLETPKGANTALAPKEIHPAVLVLGLQFAQYKICGANARCIATLAAFKKLIQDYKTPKGTTLSRHLPTYLSPQITYLVNARPMSVSMGNAIRHLKWEISTIDIDLSEDEAKSLLCGKIDEFIRDRITVPDRMIVEYGLQKIQDGDVILTYARSSVVQALLLQAHAKGIKFRVIVIDSRPRLEGKKLLRYLVDAGINCTYAFLHALGFALKDVSKVFLGAHAFMSNGALYSRVGTAMVSMMAKDKNIPVIVCCETYKFTDRVQLDSFVMNEQGNPNEMVNLSNTITPQPGQLEEWLQQADLKLLNLMYDLTPSQYITTVITEIGMIPCTSVPVILREFKPMLH